MVRTLLRLGHPRGGRSQLLWGLNRETPPDEEVTIMLTVIGHGCLGTNHVSRLIAHAPATGEGILPAVGRFNG